MNDRIRKIEQFLTSEYSNEEYTKLIRELFPTVKLVAPDRFNKEYTNFSSHIEGSSHIGNYVDPEGKKLIILSVQLKKISFVENSRSTQRGFAKKLIESANADAAFVAFYTLDDPKWRLSYVQLDYEIKFDNGKMKTRENMTPAKRYSFLVGKDEPCHTAISRFKTFISDENNSYSPTIRDLEDAFSVEKVTQEFFKLYCEKYHQLREALEQNSDFVEEAKQHNFTSAQFAKKLMGQIVFLYFLQKKGWLGVGAWPKTLTKKQYNDTFYVPGAKGKLIKEYLPKIYIQVGEDEYCRDAKVLDRIPDDVERLIADSLPIRNNWGDGSRKFLRDIFEFAQSKQANFFNDFLEPLFYNTLNVNRGNSGYDPLLHCRIPFLSGGLFEPIDGYDWAHSDFSIPNELFSNRNDASDYNADGILDIFDRYNFTISEDEPLEREVAVDPEMLGKVFENLLEINDRKSKGAFYTPREIVHYMCQETLISYLVSKTGIAEADLRDFILLGDFMRYEDTNKEKRTQNGGMFISENIYKLDDNDKVVVSRLDDIDKALRDIRIADPAVGSGAFPLGMLNEIVKARQNISAYYAITMNSYEKRMMYQTDRSPYSLKYNTIKNCIFAADIEPSAVDIAQLRLWLSLVIDDDVNVKAESLIDGHTNPLPLPNLECNILCGNSLIDEFEGKQLINRNDLIGTSEHNQQGDLIQVVFDGIIPHLIDLQNELFSCDDLMKKEKLKNEIEDIKDEIAKIQLHGCSPDLWERYIAACRQASKPFVLWQIDFARVFREKGGFDIVIGNPPYVGEKGNKDIFRPIAATSFGKKYYQGKMDLFYFFFHKALDLGNSTAEVSFITTDYFPTATGGKNLREDLKNRTQIRKLINFNELKIFESALGQHNMITFLTKYKSNDVVSHNCFCKIKGVASNSLLERILYSKTSDSEVFDCYQVPQSELFDGPEYYIRLSGCGTLEMNPYDCILNKMANSEKHLNDIAYIKQGIVSGADKYTDNHEKRFHLGFPKGKGIFVLKKDEVQDLKLTQAELSGFVKPVYKNSQVSKYVINYDDSLWVLYMDRDAEETDAPNIIEYLKQFRPLLEQRLTTYNESYPWYSLHRARDRRILEASEKIVNSRRSKSNEFALETKKYFEQSDMMVTVVKDCCLNDYPTKYVLGLLNSSLYYVWLKNKGKLKGDLLELYGAPLEELPIKSADNETIRDVVLVVDKLLKDPKNTNYQQELNRIVYKIFELTEEEVKIIENYIEG